jgi:phosphate transport system protein
MKAVIRVRLERKINKLKEHVLALGAQVEESVTMAVKALRERDIQLATKVIDDDQLIDQTEVDLEEDCLEVLALHQPVAVDLRYIVATLKINNDLERIGDLAVNIAESATLLASSEPIEIPEDYFIMAGKAREMLSMSLDAFVNTSTDLAYRVLGADDEVDTMKHKLHGDFEDKIQAMPERQRDLVHLFLVSRHLERIADQATNIAEDVIYMITGEIIRHGPSEH